MTFKAGDLVLVIKNRNFPDLVGKSGEVVKPCLCARGCIMAMATGQIFYRVDLRCGSYCMREDCLRKISPPGDLGEVETETDKAVPA